MISGPVRHAPGDIVRARAVHATTEVAPVPEVAAMTTAYPSLTTTISNATVDLPLSDVDVEVAVDSFGFTSIVTQVFGNDHEVPIEVLYTFPLPGGVAVNDCTIRIGDRVLQAELKEIEQARLEYREAVEQGFTASIVEKELSEVFSVRVGNGQKGRQIDQVVTVDETGQARQGGGDALPDRQVVVVGEAGPLLPQGTRGHQELVDPVDRLAVSVALRAGVDRQAEHAERVRLAGPEKRRAHREVLVDARELHRLGERACASGWHRRLGERRSVRDPHRVAGEHRTDALLVVPGEPCRAERQEERVRVGPVGVVRREEDLLRRNLSETVEQVDRAPRRGVEEDAAPSCHRLGEVRHVGDAGVRNDQRRAGVALDEPGESVGDARQPERRQRGDGKRGDKNWAKNEIKF